MTTANNIKILTTKFLTHCGMVTNEFPKPYRILFAVSSLGLGHATRTLSIIKSYVEMEWQVSVISHGNALKFLQDELDDTKINFIELEDYPNIERGAGLDYFFYLVTDIFSTCRLIFKEQSFVRQRIEKRYDCIISDGRYGIYSSRIPSFIISHQISFVMPKGLGLFRFIADQVNRFFLNRFDKVFIPDFPENRLSLSGKLSHNRVTENLLHKWVGILSSYTSEEIEEEIDYLFIISGYLQEQRSSFTNNLIDQAKHLPGIKVFILGDTTLHEIIRLKEQNITIYPVATGILRNKLFNQARVVISRSGYTTLMDLAELDKSAVLFPTPHQTEQEYLADFLEASGWHLISRQQNHSDLSALMDGVQYTKTFKAPWKTKKSLKIIHREVHRHLRFNRFSFVIPAHNEEKYIEKTLEHIAGLDYPEDRYEVIVVENGSDDATWEKIKIQENLSDNVYGFTCAQGVSRARNMGLSKINPHGDWVIFLDADTLCAQNFLLELNRYLGKNIDRNLVIGTTSIKPSDTSSVFAKWWFSLYDLVHSVTHTSYSIQIVRCDVASKVHYDEQFSYCEDLDYIKQAGIHGKFFFFKTDSILSSARRFIRHGYLKQTLIWLYQVLQPVSVKKGKKYEVIR